MTTDRHTAITRIVRGALSCPPAERSGFIVSACVDDPEMAAEVWSMLAQQELATVPPSLPAPVPGAPAPPPRPRTVEEGSDAEGAPSRPPGQAGPRVGRYTLTGVLGEGGMGVVYLAEQERPRRTVALKVIRPGLISERLLRRFEYESQILGRLQHPGIAQIFEAGADDSGSGPRPFFAMELVRGLPLTDYARRNSLPLRARLELFVKICDAVHHAHQKGVVHRDLKPSNILVTADGEPKVLDFGVARAADPDAQGMTLRTDAGQLVGTLPYMSPEQVAGGAADLDTRSDVYTLGVLLYELLTGRLPHRVTGKTLPEAVRIIGLEEPESLSAADASLRGDPQTIVAKALEKTVERRYQSASELAADIGRLLRHEPIAARPPTTWYQARKFAARNRALVGGVAAAFVLLTMGVVGTAWQAARAEAGRAGADEQRVLAQAAEGRALEEGEAAREINGVLTSMLAAADPDEAQGDEPTLREVLDKAAAGIEGRFAGRPAVELSVRETLGRTYHNLARYEDALTQYAAMLDLCTRTYGPDDRQTLNAKRNVLGVWADQGRYDLAEPAAVEVIAAYARRHGADEYEGAMAGMELGRIYQETGRMAQAQPLLRRAVEVGEATRGERDRQVITAMHNMGASLKDFGRPDEAVGVLRRALRLRLDTLGPAHPDTLYTKNTLAAALQRSTTPGAADEAERLTRETLADRVRVLGEDHVATITTVSNLAVMLVERKRLDEALPLAERAYLAWSAKLGEAHPKTLAAMANLGYLYEDLGRGPEAETLYRGAIAIRKRQSGAGGGAGGGGDPETWNPMNNLAMLLQKRGDFEQAEVVYRELLTLCEAALPEGHLYPAIFRNNFGECLALEGKRAEAEQLLTSSLATLESRLGPAHPRTKKAVERLAALRAYSAAPPGSAGAASPSGTP